MSATLQRDNESSVGFQPPASLATLFGKQLYSSPQTAVCELLKNSYDADASTVTVTLNNIKNPDEASIVIDDNGAGMDFNTVLNVWCEPGTDYRELQRSAGMRTPKFKRWPTGHKGIGRFAIFKLGSAIEIVTRAAGADEVAVTVTLEDVERPHSLEALPIKVVERPASLFVDGSGTRITISALAEPWTEQTVRVLRRALRKMISPFHLVESFDIELCVTPETDWIDDGLIDPMAITKLALFHTTMTVDPIAGVVSYDYSFTPQDPSKTKSRQTRHNEVPLSHRHEGALQVTSDIGAFELEIHMFGLTDTLPGQLQPANHLRIQEYLSNNAGIGIYRDGLRSDDYADTSNNWLGIDTHLMLGGVHLDSTISQSLISAGGDGFLETATVEEIRYATRAAIQLLLTECDKDQQCLDNNGEPMAVALQNLRNAFSVTTKNHEIDSLIDNMTTDYEQMRDALLLPADAGATVMIKLHETEKAITAFNRMLKRGAGHMQLVEAGERITDALTPLGSGDVETTNERASEIVAIALRSIDYVIRNEHIQITNGFNADNDFVVTVQRRLLIGAVLNLLYNASQWMSKNGEAERRIYVGPIQMCNDHGIVIVDNGPGFTDPPNFAMRPFMSRRVNGMGLGLSIVSEIMRTHNGYLVFPTATAVSGPEGHNGACVALLFNKAALVTH